MSEDKELDNLRRKKLQELISSQNQGTPEKSKLNKPQEVSDHNFQEFVGKNALTVVDCWAPWCGPCRMISPIVEQLSEEYAGRIAFGKLNVDNNRRVASVCRRFPPVSCHQDRCKGQCAVLSNLAYAGNE